MFCLVVGGCTSPHWGGQAATSLAYHGGGSTSRVDPKHLPTASHTNPLTPRRKADKKEKKRKTHLCAWLLGHRSVVWSVVSSCVCEAHTVAPFVIFTPRCVEPAHKPAGPSLLSHRPIRNCLNSLGSELGRAQHPCLGPATLSRGFTLFHTS